MEFHETQRQLPVSIEAEQSVLGSILTVSYTHLDVYKRQYMKFKVRVPFEIKPGDIMRGA